MQLESSEQPGLVISYFGNSVAVETPDGQVFQCNLRRNQELPLVGDQVKWQLDKDNTGLVISILPRRNILAKGQLQSRMKPIAANVDRLIIVMAPSPIFSEYLVDRYCVAAELLGIEPFIVINKADLMTPKSKAEALKELDIYKEIPYQAMFTSTKTGEGFTNLADLLADKTAVLVGPSGVGKSSIITKLTNKEIRTNLVSAKGIGKHTTTASRLYHLIGGGHLIDSPGTRDFNLWSISRAEVLMGFKEFQQYLTGCRFRDCQHHVEPGCTLLEAALKGLINKNRLASYQQLFSKATK